MLSEPFSFDIMSCCSTTACVTGFPGLPSKPFVLLGFLNVISWILKKRANSIARSLSKNRYPFAPVSVNEDVGYAKSIVGYLGKYTKTLAANSIGLDLILPDQHSTRPGRRLLPGFAFF